MPITVEHQPPLNWVGAAGYEAGVMGGAAQRRREIEERQMQLLQMQQSRQNQMMQMAAQQASQQQAMQVRNQQQLQDQMWRQQMQQQSDAAKLKAYQLDQQNRQAEARQAHEWKTEDFGTQHKTELLDLANANMGELSGLMGSLKRDELTGPAQTVYDTIQNDMSKLMANPDKNTIDYAYAVSELKNRSDALKAPHAKVPPPVPNAGITTTEWGQHIDRNSNLLPTFGFVLDSNKVQHNVNEIYQDPATNNVQVLQPNGELKITWDAAKTMQALYKDTEVQLDKEIAAYNEAIKQWSLGRPNPYSSEVDEDKKPTERSKAIMVPNPDSEKPVNPLAGGSRESVVAMRANTVFEDIKKKAYNTAPPQPPAPAPSAPPQPPVPTPGGPAPIPPAPTQPPQGAAPPPPTPPVPPPPPAEAFQGIPETRDQFVDMRSRFAGQTDKLSDIAELERIAVANGGKPLPEWANRGEISRFIDLFMKIQDQGPTGQGPSVDIRPKQEEYFKTISPMYPGPP